MIIRSPFLYKNHFFRVIWTCVIVPALLARPSPALGGIAPSFHLHECAWNATHIVVVTEGEKIDGFVEVKESWKGDLKKGDRPTIPELAAFAPEKARATSKRLFEKDDPNRPAHVTCSRMVLFLVKRAEKGANGKPAWEPASLWKKIGVSVAWIEQDRIYAFCQQVNPGPSQLIDWDMTETKMKERVHRIVKMRDALTTAIAQSDQAAMANALRSCLRFDSYYVGGAAIELLGQSGKSTLPVLRKTLKDQSLEKYHESVLPAMAKAGGELVGPDLTKVIEQELQFWKKTGPGLKSDWWNGADIEWKEVERLRLRYGIAHAALHALKETHFPGCGGAVTAFRNYWRSLAQLAEIGQLTEECNAVLKNLRENVSSSPYRLEDHRVVCEDGVNGIKWSAALEGKLGGVRPPHLVFNADVVCVTEGDGVTTLQAKTGNVLWHSVGPNERLLLSGDLLLATQCGHSRLIEERGRWVNAWWAVTGKEAFKVKLPAGFEDPLPIEERAGFILIQSHSPAFRGKALVVDRKGRVRLSWDHRIADAIRLGEDLILLTGDEVTRVSLEKKVRWTIPLVEHAWGDSGGILRLTGGDVLVYGYHRIADSGVALVRLDPDKGIKRWSTFCKELGVDHSKYRHRVNVTLGELGLRVSSQGSYGDFVELVDPKSGKQIQRNEFRDP